MARSIAVVLAGGSGERAGLGMPKQMALLAGKPVILHSLERFHAHPGVDEIVVVASAELRPKLRMLVDDADLSKVRKIVDGGAQRHESSVAGIRACGHAADGSRMNLLIHDAARPLVSRQTIGDVISALEQFAAVDTAIPTSDTAILVDRGTSQIEDIPERQRVRLSQTPQGFHYGLINLAYERAAADPDFHATDDCGVVRRYLPEEPIYVVQGHHATLKLTYAHELAFLEAMIALGLPD